MIRPITFLCLMAACGSGLYLYSEKHRAVLLDRDIARAIHGTEAARERTGLLRAEWALLNDPGRLQEMSDKYLSLKSMAPGQFVQMAELATHLPAPSAPLPEGPAGDPAADDGATPIVADATQPAAPEPELPVFVAKAEPPKPAPSHDAPNQMARATPKKAVRPTAVARNERLPHDVPLARGTPLPLAGLPPGGARVMAAMARPIHTSSSSFSRPAIVTAYPAAIRSAPYVGSALAGGGSLPPPVPLP